MKDRVGKVVEEISAGLKTQGFDLITSIFGGNDRFRMVAVDEIRVEEQVREKESVREGIEELATSVKESGVLQPLLVEERDGTYFLVAGERRLTAAKMAGLKMVPVLVVESMDPREKLVLQLVENIQRKDLKPSEKGKAIVSYLKEEAGDGDPERILSLLRKIENKTLKGVPEGFKVAVEKLISNLGVSLATLINWVALLTFPKWFIDEVDNPQGKLSLKDIRKFRGYLKKGEKALRDAVTGKGKKPTESRLELLRKRALKTISELIELGDEKWVKENILKLLR